MNNWIEGLGFESILTTHFYIFCIIFIVARESMPIKSLFLIMLLMWRVQYSFDKEL